MEINVSVQYKTSESKGGGDGVVSYENGEFVIISKGVAARVLFGAIGAALAKGKEVMRFTVEDIASYKAYRKMLANYISLTLKDGSELTFNYPKKVEDELLSILAPAPQEA